MYKISIYYLTSLWNALSTQTCMSLNSATNMNREGTQSTLSERENLFSFEKQNDISGTVHTSFSIESWPCKKYVSVLKVAIVMHTIYTWCKSTKMWQRSCSLRKPTEAHIINFCQLWLFFLCWDTIQILVFYDELNSTVTSLFSFYCLGVEAKCHEPQCMHTSGIQKQTQCT